MTHNSVQQMPVASSPDIANYNPQIMQNKYYPQITRIPKIIYPQITQIFADYFL